ncbi:hypothetical protein Q5752_001509 [Cryptotrichosporon argae]
MRSDASQAKQASVGQTEAQAGSAKHKGIKGKCSICRQPGHTYKQCPALGCNS